MFFTLVARIVDSYSSFVYLSLIFNVMIEHKLLLLFGAQCRLRRFLIIFFINISLIDHNCSSRLLALLCPSVDDKTCLRLRSA
uniref:Uncharacterized protein n=1 Tax=Pararge aegeria TaxID=116150 RepID=S4PS08_9NEOP